MRPPRWPFTAALAAVVVGGGVASAAPAPTEGLGSDYVSLADLQDYHAAKRAWTREQPAADLLASLVPPAGVASCPAGQPGDAAKRHFLCWEGDTEPRATNIALAQALRAVGATGLDLRCRVLMKVGVELCNLTAEIRGVSFTASSGPNLDKPGGPYTGVQVVGGLGSAGTMIQVPSARMTPVPIPMS